MTEAHGLHSAVDGRGIHSYCGPAAIAALLGVTPEAAELAIKATSKRRRLRGVRAVGSLEMAPAIEYLGGKVTARDGRPARTTLRSWLRRHHDDPPTIILITGHYITVHRGMLVDSRYRTPVHVEACLKYLRKRVKYTFTAERE